MLFWIRLGAGDLYPTYSSLRADPLGTRLLHDSLKEIPGLRVERSYERFEKMGTKPSRTIILAGMSPVRWARLRPEAINALDAAVRNGSRLVVIFEAHSSVYTQPRRIPWDADLPTLKESPAKKAKQDADKTKEGDLGKADEIKPALPDKTAQRQQKLGRDNGSDYKDDEDFDPPDGMKPGSIVGNWVGMDLFQVLWGVDLYARMIMDRDLGALRSAAAPAGFPASIRWRSCSYLVFSKGSPWRVLYTRGSLPVMAEMNHGAGSIVMATDAYCVSNESLQEAAPVGVLSWLVGASDTVIFDEAHLGLKLDRGVAALARRYGLLPAMLLLTLAGLLYIWRQSVRFIPPQEEGEEVVLEFHPTAGLEALLRRAVPGSKIYETCVAEWRRHARPGDLLRLQSVQVLARGAAAYNAALAVLRRGVSKK